MVPDRLVLSAESGAQFQEGIGLVLSRWATLQIAVANEWGGRHSRLKSQQLAPDIFSWFTLSKEQLYIDDLEDMLDEFMLSLNMEIHDGSVEEKKKKISAAAPNGHSKRNIECLEGNYQSIQTLREANPPAAVVPHIQGGDSDDEDDDNSSGMVIDAPNFQSNRNHRELMMGDEPRPSERVEAEDGWTVVAPRRNRGTRS